LYITFKALACDSYKQISLSSLPHQLGGSFASINTSLSLSLSLSLAP